MSETLAAGEETGETDRISNLPEPIVHRILWPLVPAELLRMSVLSKTWFDLTASFPTLDFSIHKFRHLSRESFFKYVDYTISRFCQHQDDPAHRLTLTATLHEPAELDVVNRCVKLLLNKGVKVLEMYITSANSIPKYRLPDILLSVSVLKYLTIYGCELPSSLMLDEVMFTSLIQLRLEYVPIDDEVITYLTAVCPLLQVFHVSHCRGFKRFCVYGHQNLHQVWIYYNNPVEIIDIEAPNLYTLLVAEWECDGRGAPRMNLSSCKKLTTVTYFGNLLPDSNGFSDFLVNFPFIENMFLSTRCEGNKLKLSSRSLRKLVLHSNCNFEEIEFNTPNLVYFVYTCNPRLLLCTKDKRWLAMSGSTNFKASMQIYPGGYVDTHWFKRLRQFLHKNNRFRIFNLYIDALYSKKFTKLKRLKAIELPPYELEHVEPQLERHDEPLAHIAFVDAVLWCCRPRSLTLRSSVPFTDFDDHLRDVVEFTYEKLLQQEDEGNTDIDIFLPPPSSFLVSLLPGEGRTICFVKEEVPQEEANNQIIS